MSQYILQNNKQNERWFSFLYGFFLIAIIIDVGGAFGVKYLAFIILSLSLVLYILVNDRFSFSVNTIIIEGTLFIFIPLFFVCTSVIIYNVPIANAVRGALPFITWLLYPILINIYPREKIVLIFKRTMFFAAIIILLFFLIIYLLYLTNKYNLINEICLFSRNYRLGYIGGKNFGEINYRFVPNVYFGWSMLLIPASVLFLKENKIKFFIVFLAAILTFSTAIIIFTIFACTCAIFAESYSKKKYSYILKQIFTMIVFFVLFILILNCFGYGFIVHPIFEKVFSPLTSQSTSIKIGHIKSIIHIFVKNPFILLFGMGVGSDFYEIELGEIVVGGNTEVSHINFVRQFGILYALLFLVYILYLFFRLYKKGGTERLLSIGFIALFFSAGTNPLLISPIFFIVMVIARAYLETTKIKYIQKIS